MEEHRAPRLNLNHNPIKINNSNNRDKKELEDLI